MCTVSYIPKLNNDFILTSNRDEGVNRRPSSGPWVKDNKGLRFLCPIDEEAGGTWFTASSDGRVYCLLNGAFEAHEKTPPYRKSRGLVFLDLLSNISINSFTEHYNLENIEPFTVAAIENIQSDQRKLSEFRWDGKKKHLKILDENKAFIWSSSTLYNSSVRKMREKWFFEWFEKHPEPSGYEVYKFHRFGGNTDLENSFYMDRGVIKTVSITQILSKNWGFHMDHKNFITHEKNSQYLELGIKVKDTETNTTFY